MDVEGSANLYAKQRRAAAQHEVDRLGLSERKACGIVGLCRAAWQYEPKPESLLNTMLRVRIREIAAQRRRFGSFRIWQIRSEASSMQRFCNKGYDVGGERESTCESGGNGIKNV